MASKVAICNKALLRIGQAPIQAITEQSTEAAYCRQFYDDCRKAVLRDHDWNFAAKISSMNLLADEESYKYLYVYQLPADCIAAREVHPDEGYADPQEKVPFEVIGRTLHTDMEDARLKYTWDIEDATVFDPSFVDLMSYRMAADLAMPITRDANYVNSMMSMYFRFLAVARTADGREGYAEDEVGRSFINARG